MSKVVIELYVCQLVDTDKNKKHFFSKMLLKFTQNSSHSSYFILLCNHSLSFGNSFSEDDQSLWSYFILVYEVLYSYLKVVIYECFNCSLFGWKLALRPVLWEIDVWSGHHSKYLFFLVAYWPRNINAYNHGWFVCERKIINGPRYVAKFSNSLYNDLVDNTSKAFVLLNSWD